MPGQRRERRCGRVSEEGRLIGFLSSRVAAPYGGQRVYVLDDDRYVLADGKAVERDVLQRLLLRGLLMSPEASQITVISDMSPFVPDRIDPLAADGVVFIKDRESAVARVSYHANQPYEGDLLFRSNLESHFVSEKGYVLGLEALQKLGEDGHLLVPKSTKPRDPYTLHTSVGGTLAVSDAERFARRQHFAKLAFLFVAIMVVVGIAYLFTEGLADVKNDAQKSLLATPKTTLQTSANSTSPADGVAGAQQGLAGAEASTTQGAANAVNGAGNGNGGVSPASKQTFNGTFVQSSLAGTLPGGKPDIHLVFKETGGGDVWISYLPDLMPAGGIGAGVSVGSSGAVSPTSATFTLTIADYRKVANSPVASESVPHPYLTGISLAP